MPDANAATQSAPGAGGPGQGGTPGQPPAQPGVAAAPHADGPVPAAPPAPDGARPPAPGTVAAEPTKEDRWGNAAASLGLTGDAKRARDRDRVATQVRELLKRTGAASLDELEALVARAHPSAQPPVQAPPPPMPASPQAQSQPASEILDWHRSVFTRINGGYDDVQWVVEDRVDPQTGEMAKVPRQVQRRVDRDPDRALAYAQAHQSLFRDAGVTPPWFGLPGFPGQTAPAPSQPQPPAQSFTLDEVEERFAQRDAAKTAWQGSFGARMAKAAAEEYGHDWFAQVRMVEVNGQQVPMSRGQELAFRSQPSRDYPNGLTLEEGMIVTRMLGDAMERIRLVADANARNVRATGGVPTGASGGPPADPSAVQAHVAAMVRSGIAGGHFAAVPLDTAAEVVRVRGGTTLPRGR